MPVAFRQSGYRFHFFSNEGDPREPVHVHVTKDGKDAKFRLQPTITLAYSHGFTAHALAELARIVAAHRTEIEKVWHDHFGEGQLGSLR